MFLDSVKFGNYKDPIIPDGFRYVSGDWDELQIENRRTGGKWNWFPVGAVKPAEVLPPHIYTMRNGVAFCGEKFDKHYYNEASSPALIKSLEKTGGVYLPAYFLSQSKNDVPRSLEGEYPWVNINFHDAMTVIPKLRAELKKSDAIVQMLPGSLYDALIVWMIQKGARTWESMTQNSTEWGNYPPEKGKGALQRTGSEPKHMTLGYDWPGGNVQLWTSERYHQYCRVLRSGSYKDYSPAAARMPMMTDFAAKNLSFMVYMGL